MNLILLRSNELKETADSSSHEGCDGSNPKRQKGAATKVFARLGGVDHRAMHITQHLRKKVGDQVEIPVPKGTLKFEVLAIRHEMS